MSRDDDTDDSLSTSTSTVSTPSDRFKWRPGCGDVRRAMLYGLDHDELSQARYTTQH
eukprot:m.79498 g.79498  ORF g.79498 m.79498 type:complete len:57 (-) comp14515_c1_seq1:16-186(-)